MTNRINSERPYDAQLKKVKEMMLEENIEFNKIMHAFLDVSQGHADFRADCEMEQPIMTAELSVFFGKCIESSGRSVDKLSLYMIRKNTRHSLIEVVAGHGRDELINWIFFADIKVGLQAVANARSIVCDFTRITLTDDHRRLFRLN